MFLTVDVIGQKVDVLAVDVLEVDVIELDQMGRPGHRGAKAFKSHGSATNNTNKISMTLVQATF